MPSESQLTRLLHNFCSTAIFKLFRKLRKETISFVFSVRLLFRMEQLASHRTDFCEILYWRIFRKKKLIRKFKFHWNLTRITGNLHEGLCKFIIATRWILLRMRKVSDKTCRENQNARFTFSIQFFRKSYNSPTTGRIFVKFYIGVFFEKKITQKIQIALKPNKNNEYFTRRPM